MKTLLLLICIVLSQPLCAEPQNLSLLKKEVKHYYNSGQYTYELSQVVQSARDYLKQRVEENKKLAQPKKLAVVLDIDETSLSNYPILSAYDFSVSGKNAIWKNLDKVDAVVIPATLRLVHYAQKNHVAVFFVTGREQAFESLTVKNLQAVGYQNWAGIYFQPAHYHKPSLSYYKTDTRKKITAEGYDIVLNIGDQYSDLKGGYADRVYKLPNPYYFVP